MFQFHLRHSSSPSLLSESTLSPSTVKDLTCPITSCVIHCVIYFFADVLSSPISELAIWPRCPACGSYRSGGVAYVTLQSITLSRWNGSSICLWLVSLHKNIQLSPSFSCPSWTIWLRMKWKPNECFSLSPKWVGWWFARKGNESNLTLLFSGWCWLLFLLFRLHQHRSINLVFPLYPEEPEGVGANKLWRHFSSAPLSPQYSQLCDHRIKNGVEHASTIFIRNPTTKTQHYKPKES